jgi:hypothetical protein
MNTPQQHQSVTLYRSEIQRQADTFWSSDQGFSLGLHFALMAIIFVLLVMKVPVMEKRVGSAVAVAAVLGCGIYRLDLINKLLILLF